MRISKNWDGFMDLLDTHYPRFGETGFQLASDAKVKQTFLDLAQAYRNMAFDVELLFSLREKAGLVSRAAWKNT
jgi:hypothetical protein